MRIAELSIPKAKRSVTYDVTGWFPLGHTLDESAEAVAFFGADGSATSHGEFFSARQAYVMFQSALWEAWGTSVNASSSDRVRSSLYEAITKTNSQLFAATIESDVIREQYVSQVSAICYRGIMVFQNLGNVRLILLRDKKFHLLTEDHTFGGSMKRKGPLKGDSAIQHPFGGVCSAWLGKEKTIEPRFKSIILQPNDVILIMTDGMADLRAPKILKRRLGLQLDEWGRHFSSVVGLVDFLEQQLLFHLSVKKPAKDDATSMIVGFTADDLIQPVLPPHKDRAKLPPSRPKPAPEWILPREAIDHRPITGVSEPGFGPE